MNRTLLTTVAGSVLAVTALAGCSSQDQPSNTGSGSSGGLYGSPASTAPSTGQAGGTSGGAASTPTGALSTASSDLGQIVVDGKGMTAYFYDPDTAGSGKSTCTGACASLWPAIESGSSQPQVNGVTGTVGTITGVDGGQQVTINGRPIYTYAADSGPGDTHGQGVDGIWHVVAPDGTEITTAAKG